MLHRKTYLIVSAYVLLILISGCKKSGEVLERVDLKTTEVIEMTTNQTNAAESLEQPETESKPNVVYDFQDRKLKRVIIDGKVVMENDYNDMGLRIAKKGNDSCKFTYDENRNLIKEERNGKFITYFYEKDAEYEYWHIRGFNYEGKTYYYTRDDNSRINGIQNEDKELVAKYEYISRCFKVSKIMMKQGEEWVCTDDPEFIGNINKIRSSKDYYDEECDLYESTGVFYIPTTGNVVMDNN